VKHLVYMLYTQYIYGLAVHRVLLVLQVYNIHAKVLPYAA